MGVGVGLVDVVLVERGVGVGLGVPVGVGEILFERTLIVALLLTTLTPVESLEVNRKLPPVMPIIELPEPVTRKVKVAKTPEESVDMSEPAMPSDKPPVRMPFQLN